MAQKFLYINARDEFFRVDISRIVYFEAEGNYTNIILSNKLKGIVCMNLSQMQTVLSDNLKEAASIFARVGKSHIINLNYVYHISILRQRLTLSDGINFEYALSVSKEALKKLRELFISGLSSQIPLNESENEQ